MSTLNTLDMLTRQILTWKDRGLTVSIYQNLDFLTEYWGWGSTVDPKGEGLIK